MHKPVRKRLHEHLDTATLHKLAGLFLVVFAFTIVILLVSELLGGTEQLRGLVERAGAWAPIAYIAAKASTYIFAPLSGASIELTAGALFGVWPALLFSVIGNTVGGSINYWIARTLGRKGIAWFAGKKALSQIDDTTERVSNWKALAVARVVLAPIYDFISYAAGLVRVPFWQFLLITAFVGAPVTLFFPLIGNIAAGSAAVVYLLIGVFVLLGSVLGLLLWRHARKNRVDS